GYGGRGGVSGESPLCGVGHDLEGEAGAGGAGVLAGRVGLVADVDHELVRPRRDPRRDVEEDVAEEGAARPETPGGVLFEVHPRDDPALVVVDLQPADDVGFKDLAVDPWR